MAPLLENPSHNRPAQLNELTISLGQKTDQYITLPVSLMESLNKLVVNGRVVEFRKAGDGREVLMSCMASRVRKPAAWSFVFDKDARRVFRQTEGRLVTVVWG